MGVQRSCLASTNKIMRPLPQRGGGFNFVLVSWFLDLLVQIGETIFDGMFCGLLLVQIRETLLDDNVYSLAKVPGALQPTVDQLHIGFRGSAIGLVYLTMALIYYNTVYLLFFNLSEKFVEMLKFFNNVGVFRNDQTWFPCYYTLNTMWNYTDVSKQFCKVCIKLLYV